MRLVRETPSERSVRSAVVAADSAGVGLTCASRLASSLSVRGKRSERCLGITLAALTLLVGQAHAEQAPPPSAPSPSTGATPDPALASAASNNAAARLIADVLAQASATTGGALVIVEPVRATREALERASGARASGDLRHAGLLEALALEYAETAQALLRAATLEASVDTDAARARDLAARVERARTLLEETHARLGRQAAELAKAEAEAKEAVRAAAEAEAKRIERSKSGRASSGSKKPKAGVPSRDGAKSGKKASK